MRNEEFGGSRNRAHNIIAADGIHGSIRRNREDSRHKGIKSRLWNNNFSCANTHEYANIVIKIRRTLRMPAAKIRRNDAEIFDRPSSASNICSHRRCRSRLNQWKKEFPLLFNHFRKIGNSLKLIEMRRTIRSI